MEEQNSRSLLVGMQDGAVTLDDSLSVSYKNKHTLTIPSSNHIPWYLLKGAEKHIHTKTCIWMIIVALFIIVKTWKEPRCPLVNEQMNKLCYSQTVEYNSVLKNISYQAIKRHGGILSIYSK